MLSPAILKVLACPWCVTRKTKVAGAARRGELELLGAPEQPESLRCRDCGRIYPIRDGIPSLLATDNDDR